MIYKISKLKLSVLVLGLTTLFSGCFFSSKNNQKTGIVRLVNVLDKEFFDDCHIPGSLNISMLDVKKASEQWSKNDTIVFYCSNYSCQASPQCCRTLQKLGFNYLFDYEAGMAGWYQAHMKDPEGYPINGVCKQRYLTLENKPFDDDQEDDVKKITTQELKVLLEASKQNR